MRRVPHHYRHLRLNMNESEQQHLGRGAGRTHARKLVEPFSKASRRAFWNMTLIYRAELQTPSLSGPWMCCKCFFFKSSGHLQDCSQKYFYCRLLKLGLSFLLKNVQMTQKPSGNSLFPLHTVPRLVPIGQCLKMYHVGHRGMMGNDTAHIMC